MADTLCIVLIDQTNGAATTDGEKLSPQALAMIASAVSLQLNQDLAPEWGGTYAVRAASSPTDIQPGEIAFGIVDTLPDAPGAIAYHDIQGAAVPFALDAITLNANLFGPGVSLSSSISHECCEMAGDLGCNVWADTGNGIEVARELCDAVEQQGYPIPVVPSGGGSQQNVWVSNFLMKAFFVAGAPAPLDFMSSLAPNAAAPAAPFTTANANGGNYQIERLTVGEGSDVTADKAAPANAIKPHRPAVMPPPPPQLGPPRAPGKPVQLSPEDAKKAADHTAELVAQERERRAGLWGPKKGAPVVRVRIIGTPARHAKRANWSSRTYRRGVRFPATATAHAPATATATAPAAALAST